LTEIFTRYPSDRPVHISSRIDCDALVHATTMAMTCLGTKWTWADVAITTRLGLERWASALLPILSDQEVETIVNQVRRSSTWT
jgi:hypothetical protein